ncbi:hypothetical protein T484DRAFT_1832340, partial [Baffinella frigidus]
MKENNMKSLLDSAPFSNVQSSLLDTAPFSGYRRFFSLAEWRYAGTALLVKKSLAPPKITYEFGDGVDTFAGHDENGRIIVAEFPSDGVDTLAGHDENGRIIVAEFPSGLRVLNTYVPMNGWSEGCGCSYVPMNGWSEEKNFGRRRAWDARMLAFASRAKEEGRDFVWLGDLNVAHQDCDVSDPTWFRAQKDRGKNGVPVPAVPPEDKGQPGYSQNKDGVPVPSVPAEDKGQPGFSQ